MCPKFAFASIQVRENRAEVRKSALLAERLRAAQVVSGRPKGTEEKKASMVEVGGDGRRKRVTLSSRRRLVESPKAEERAAAVRRIPLSEVGNTGREAAVKERERQTERDAAVMRQMEAARKRGDAAVRKAWEERKRAAVAADVDERDELSTIQEVTEPLPSSVASSAATRSKATTTTAQVHWRPDRDDVDTVPVRGPSSSSSAESSREEPTMRFGGGPDSAFSSVRPRTAPASAGVSDRDFAAVRELLARVERQKRELTFGGEGGGGSGAKNDQADRNFVAKVLGVSPEKLAAIAGGASGEKVKVKLNVVEVSGSSSGSSSHPSSSSSSSDLTRERFLNPDFGSVRGLIGELRSGAAAGAANESRLLRGYIEKLLDMRREEIAELSVTTVEDTATSVGTDSSKDFVSSTPASILSSSKSTSTSSSSGGSKTVRFVDQADGSYRKERRADSSAREAEAIAERTRESMEAVRTTFEGKKKEIEAELAKRFEKRLARQMRDRSRRPDADAPAPTPPISEGPLSDTTREEDKSGSSSGAVTDSTKESSLTSTGGDPQLDAPELAAMLQNLRQQWAQSMLRRARNYDAETSAAAATKPTRGTAAANKSSSSGTTSSGAAGGGGSQAVAELREKLARMEMPELARPRPRVPQPTGGGDALRAVAAAAAAAVTTSTSDDTFARVAELLSDEVAGAAAGAVEESEFSSFHFSSGDDEDGAGIEDEQEVTYVSVSGESNNGGKK